MGPQADVHHEENSSQRCQAHRRQPLGRQPGHEHWTQATDATALLLPHGASHHHSPGHKLPRRSRGAGSSSLCRSSSLTRLSKPPSKLEPDIFLSPRSAVSHMRPRTRCFVKTYALTTGSSANAELVKSEFVIHLTWNVTFENKEK